MPTRISSCIRSQSDEEARGAQAASMRDQTFGWEMRTWARLQTKTGKSKAWLYYFSHVPPGIPAPHGRAARRRNRLRLRLPESQERPGHPWADYDKKLADTVSSYWFNFAAKGDPNGKGLPQWPNFRANDEMAMGFGDEIKVIPVPNKPALDFLDTYYEKLWKSGSTGGQ